MDCFYIHQYLMKDIKTSVVYTVDSAALTFIRSGFSLLVMPQMDLTLVFFSLKVLHILPNVTIQQQSNFH